jgi:hypothetical protein
MASSSPNPSSTDPLDGTLAFAAGAGIVTLALFPLAIPIVGLTAVALIPLLIPLLLIPLAVGLVAAPFLLLRRLFRRAAVPGKGQTKTTPKTQAPTQYQGPKSGSSPTRRVRAPAYRRPNG